MIEVRVGVESVPGSPGVAHKEDTGVGGVDHVGVNGKAVVSGEVLLL